MSYLWTPKAERGLRDLGLSPCIRTIQSTFEDYKIGKSSKRFGSHPINEMRKRRLVHWVVFRFEPPVVMDLDADDDLVTELVVRCIVPEPERRDKLYERDRVVYRGIVLSADSASKLIGDAGAQAGKVELGI